MKLHHLLDKMPGHQFRTDCQSAICFDLGELQHVHDLAVAAPKEIFRCPASLCLFKAGDDYVLIRDHSDRLEANVVMADQRGVLRLLDLRIVGTSHAEPFKIYTYDGAEVDRLKPLPIWMGQTLILVAKIVAACEVFSCSNVEIIAKEPSQFANRMRVEKKKTPLFTWRTLHIRTEATQGKGKPTATHASPRLHFRRGHIRRLPCGQKVWVRECLVGDSSLGYADKQYTVARRSTV